MYREYESILFAVTLYVSTSKYDSNNNSFCPLPPRNLCRMTIHEEEDIVNRILYEIIGLETIMWCDIEVDGSSG